ncbi:MAG: CAP domain-containing protein [Acidothermaceae bacterium]
MLIVIGPARPRAATRAVMGALAVVLAISTSVAWARGARADSSSSLVSLTNSARASAGLPGLAVSADLAAVARGQAARMAAAHTLQHTPNLSQAVCCWQKLGENVGYGGSPSVIQAAFMASPMHRANILDAAYTQIGIGSAVDANGILWVSEIFRRPTSQAPAQAPNPAPKPAPKPQPVVTRTTAPAPAPNPVRPATRAARSTPPASATGLRSSASVPAVGDTGARVVAGGRASRALDAGRLPLSAAQRLAAEISASSAAMAPDPVSRLISFVDIAVEATP